ncbi:MAG: lipopolysaccharide heptosyltransferase family protein [Ignavibacteriales bacterium]|nr:MAG: lipopolysaccharide heptosyltransferase family protein [Ignavibacteriales bacterium]
MNILIIALSGIGDALMFTPSLVKLSEEIPNAEIDVLVMYQGVKDIYEKLPQISKVRYFDFLNSSKLKSLFYVLKLRNKYDATINIYPSNRREYNLISRIIGAEKRLAIKYLRKDFLNFGFLNNIRLLENDNLHNVEENFFLCEKLIGKKLDSIPALKLNLRNDDVAFANNFFKDKSISNNDIVIGFHPGCSTLKNHEKRRWEASKFAELGKKLIQDYNAKVLLFGGGEEEILKDIIFAKIDSQNVYSVNAHSLSNSAAVMQRCNLFITNDSSLMHIAAALKLNIVVIIGPTNRNYIYPWQTNYKIASLDLDCSPCFYYSPKPLTCSRSDLKFKCIKDLSVNLVYEKVKEFLAVKI